jgi:hypothetical protein
MCSILTLTVHAARRSRPTRAGLRGQTYSAAQMTYIERRLRLRGFIQRQPRTYRYSLTAEGLRVTFFCSKLYLRILRPHAPALVSDPDPVPRALRTAFEQLDAAIDHIYQEAALAA